MFDNSSYLYILDLRCLNFVFFFFFLIVLFVPGVFVYFSTLTWMSFRSPSTTVVMELRSNKSDYFHLSDPGNNSSTGLTGIIKSRTT